MTFYLDKGAHAPERGSADAAGIDLRARIPSDTNDGCLIIPCGQREFFDLGVHFAIPRGYCGILCNRSGMAKKRAVYTVLGIIDSDYRGSVGVTLVNNGHEPFIVHDGDRITQMIVIPCSADGLREVGDLDMLGETARGGNGFGSTGM